MSAFEWTMFGFSVTAFSLAMFWNFIAHRREVERDRAREQLRQLRQF